MYRDAMPRAQPIPVESMKQPAGDAFSRVDSAVRDNISMRASMIIQVTPIENWYVIGISTERGSMPRLIYATDLTDVGHQITAFAVALELEGKCAKT